MAPRSVRLWPDPVLSQPCDTANLFSPVLPALVSSLFDTMYAASGRGLAAPQIGVLKQVFVVDVSWKEGAPDPRTFINPFILSRGDSEVVMDEMCLSIPDVPMPVSRPERIELRWCDLNAQPQRAWFDGILARCIQHEFDHLNGKVIFDHQSPAKRAELESAYAT